MPRQVVGHTSVQRCVADSVVRLGDQLRGVQAQLTGNDVVVPNSNVRQNCSIAPDTSKRLDGLDSGIGVWRPTATSDRASSLGSVDSRVGEIPVQPRIDQSGDSRDTAVLAQEVSQTASDF